MDPTQLPVYQQKDRILATLARHQVIVVESPTGSGKTTQIPQILLEAGLSGELTIGVTQPRRIAAVSVAEFIARQRGTGIPDLVGYKMRFEDMTDPRTRIKIMTDGILLQEIKADYSLSRYGVMMVDEAHERSLNIDFILGLLKRVLRERPTFKVVVSSATINAEVFSEYFDECPIVKIDTATYPVEVIHEPPEQEGSEEAMTFKIGEIVARILERQHGEEDRRERPSGRIPGNAAGDVLIFLPGEGSIKQCIAELALLPGSRQLELLPLYSRLSSQEQERVFLEYPGKTKVIVATNIAETSVTIDGVAWVVDSGLAKLNFYNPRTFTSSLIEVPVSKASANQRRGRAGRTRPGVCYRLYRKEDYESRPLFTPEEIFRTDLSEVVLRMAELGIRDFEQFDFISQPGREAILAAVETLRLLEAVDDRRELTATGILMVRFPIIPRISRIIVEGINRYPGVLAELLVAAAFLSTRSPFLLPVGEELAARKAHHSFRDPAGDFLSYLKLFRAFRRSRDAEGFCRRYYLDLRSMNEIVNIHAQLEEIVSELGVPIESGHSVPDYLCAIARGLIQFVCVRTGRGIYRTLTADRIQIHPGSVMFREDPDYIVAGEIVRTSRTYARSVSPLRREWLAGISPLIAERLLPRGRPGRPDRERRQPETIQLGGEAFRIVTAKGKKKTVILPWEKLRGLRGRLDPKRIPGAGGLRGKIIHGEYEIGGGMRLKSLLRLAEELAPEKGFLDVPPEGNYRLPGDYRRLEEQIPAVLRLCRLKKKRLGFVALMSDGLGTYWFQAVRNYVSALTETLSSLESLADTPGLDPGPQVNTLYRGLAERLERL